MSTHAIHEYQNEVEKIIHYGGTKKETAIRNAFYNLLNSYARQKGLMIVPEIEIKASNSNRRVTPDGTLKDALRQDWGYWESKDESDILDEEIQKKFDKGYPKENILFEDSQLAILIQNGIEVLRVSMKDSDALHDLITRFISFERPEVRHFRKAIELFKQDIPKVTDSLRKIIIEAEGNNQAFAKASQTFLKLCHDSINPEIAPEDVREMIIQHILTEDVFNTIFDENQFHRENNIARELEQVIHTFFTGSLRRTALGSIQHYYQAINAAAAGIADHHEKQKFLKVIYETFYKSYNPKAADRLGVVYTPNEVVQFMIKSTNYLLHKHFNKFLDDKNVEILDPATGTGTFICDIIDFLPKDKLEYKYRNEIHANEVAILPYYISNLNIEYTYKQKMGNYVEFENLCFVDTLDNLGFAFTGKQIDMFSPFTEENSKRIKKQNSRKIAVVIGNPPYNANQANENENNKNREYPQIDQRIKDTFIENSNAQKTKTYDPYSRFYRWAMDRLDNNGIISFITNRSFIDSKTFDGFRKSVLQEFNFAYIIDTRSDVRSNPKLSGSKHNIFGIQAGVAIMFLVKKSSKQKKENCVIQYTSLEDNMIKEDKLQWLSENQLQDITFTHIIPDAKNKWINITANDFDEFIPLCSKDVKTGKSNKAIFKLLSLGVVTNRDEWCYDFDKRNLEKKIRFFCEFYEQEKVRWQNSTQDVAINDFVDRTIKWTEELESHLIRRSDLRFDQTKIRVTNYRPFSKKYSYVDRIITHRLYQNPNVWGLDSQFVNKSLILTIHPQVDLSFFCSDTIVDQGFGSRASTVLPLYSYDLEGNQFDNITDWAFNQFAKRYSKKKMTKERIFNYVYAVLNNPIYREKYELNLKDDYPRIPFYDDFELVSDLGKQLLDIHLNYETAAPYPLKIVETNTKATPVVKLKSNKEKGVITIDENTILLGVPVEAWQYKLANRSAIDWVLDQSKESKVKDPTIASKFDNYQFDKHKDRIIDLLAKVCTVSVKTIKITSELSKLGSHSKKL